MASWGLCLGPAWGTSLADLVGPARAAEEAGFDRIATGEYRSDALTWLGALAAATRHVPVATTIASIALRHPTVTAEAVAGLRDVYGDRIELGLGVSHPSLVSEDLGLPQPSLADLEQYVAAVRSVWAGVAASHDRYRVPAHERHRRSGGTAPVLVAALGQRATGHAAGYADGVILTWSPVSWTRHLVEVVRDRDARSGRRTPVWVVLPTLIHDEVQEARTACARHLRPYLDLPSYRSMLGSAVTDPERLDAAAAAPDPQATAQILGAGLIDEVGAVGPPHRIADAAAAAREAGADEVVLYPLDTGSGWREAVEATITRCAPAR